MKEQKTNKENLKEKKIDLNNEKKWNKNKIAKKVSNNVKFNNNENKKNNTNNKKINIKLNKKIIFYIIIAIGILLIIICNFSTEVLNNVENVSEIQPQEEENNEDTNLKLYYIDKTSGILRIENKKIKIKELIDQPYKKILELLISGPEDNNKLINEIPKDTKINNIELKKGTLKIDLSENFLNSKGTNAIYQIVNTMTEFNEIDNIQFLMDGKERNNLNGKFVRK